MSTSLRASLTPLHVEMPGNEARDASEFYFNYVIDVSEVMKFCAVYS